MTGRAALSVLPAGEWRCILFVSDAAHRLLCLLSESAICVLPLRRPGDAPAARAAATRRLSTLHVPAGNECLPQPASGLALGLSAPHDCMTREFAERRTNSAPTAAAKPPKPRMTPTAARCVSIAVPPYHIRTVCQHALVRLAPPLCCLRRRPAGCRGGPPSVQWLRFAACDRSAPRQSGRIVLSQLPCPGHHDEDHHCNDHDHRDGHRRRAQRASGRDGDNPGGVARL